MGMNLAYFFSSLAVTFIGVITRIHFKVKSEEKPNENYTLGFVVAYLIIGIGIAVGIVGIILMAIENK